MDDLYSEGAESDLLGQRRRAAINRLESFCPELQFNQTGVAPEHEHMGGNIKVRHIQPMGQRAQIPHRTVSSSEPDAQSRKSLSLLRKAFFEQTAKIFQPYKGSLIYDVMNPNIEKKFESADG